MTNNKPNLLPCPSCGSKAAVTKIRSNPKLVDWVTVCCTNENCAMQTMPIHALNTPMVIDVWNRRVPHNIEAVTGHDRWLPVTPKLLTEIESGLFGDEFWLAANGCSKAFRGIYQWKQGHHPHGFISESGSRWASSVISHVMPCGTPELPTVKDLTQGVCND